MSIFYLFIECLYLISSQCFIFIDRENVKKKKKNRYLNGTLALNWLKYAQKNKKGYFYYENYNWFLISNMHYLYFSIKCNTKSVKNC